MRRLALTAALLAAACAPTAPPRPGAVHASDADLTVTRLLHAGVLLQLDGRHFLVDPWLYDGVMVRQREPLGLHPDAFPPVAAVLLTAGGGTRADPATLTRLARTIPVLVTPPALGPRAAAFGFRDLRALAWWEETTFGDTRVTAVPAEGNGYLLRGPDVVVYAVGPGTTAATAAEVARRAGDVDVALLPVDAGGTRVHPAAAAAVAAAIGARRVVPIGYGASGPIGGGPGDDAVGRLRDAIAAAGGDPATLVALDSGESWHFYR